MEPTHALYVIDNWDGESDRYWVFAYKDDGVFHSSENTRKILQHVGDEILKQVELT